MSAPKFTPGPWVVAQRILPSDAVHADSIDLLRMDGYAINVPRDTLSSYPEADIALIAAAPDMYEALRDLLTVGRLNAMEWHAAAQRAERVIAKVEGRS